MFLNCSILASMISWGSDPLELAPTPSFHKSWIRPFILYTNIQWNKLFNTSNQSCWENWGGLGQIKNVGPLALTDIAYIWSILTRGMPHRRFLEIRSSEIECMWFKYIYHDIKIANKFLTVMLLYWLSVSNISY